MGTNKTDTLILKSAMPTDLAFRLGHCNMFSNVLHRRKGKTHLDTCENLTLKQWTAA